MKRFSACWLFDSATGNYTDLTSYLQTNSPVNFLSANTQTWYLGSDCRIAGIYVDLSTNGSYTGITYQYSDGFNWFTPNLIDSYDFSISKYIRWNLPTNMLKFQFTNTFPVTGTPPDSVDRYWISISCSDVTTLAFISKLRVIPFVEYTTAENVNNFLQFKKPFDQSTHPSDFTVENIIRRQEDMINYKTKKSWRFDVTTEQTDPVLVDFNRYGFFLRQRNFSKVYSVKIWDGNTWNQLTEGRQFDYFVNYDLGMIYLTRLYLLPAVYGMSGRYTSYDFGEYKNCIQVDFAYGRDSETDREFYVVEDLATKMAAIDIIRHHDYSNFVAGNTAMVSLDSKIANLEQEISEKIEDLSGVSIN